MRCKGRRRRRQSSHVALSRCRLRRQFKAEQQFDDIRRPGKESLVAEIRTIVDLGKNWQYESNTETLGLAYAFRPTFYYQGSGRGQHMEEYLPASPVGCLTILPIFFERRLAAIGAIGDLLITPSAFYELKGGLN